MNAEMALHDDGALGTESRLTRLETKMDSVMEMRRWMIWSVILSALALGTRAFDLAQAWIGKH